jgi:integrase
MLDLENGTMPIPADLAKNRREHRVYLTELEVSLLREQCWRGRRGTSLVFPNPEGRQWDRARFRDRVWVKSVEAAARADREASGRGSSVFDGFDFHWLRHTAGSLMAVAGLDPAVASERIGHSDGGALFLKTYRHLYEGEKRVQAGRLEAHVRARLDGAWATAPGERGRTA